jgi:protein O-mannosyl-transferase
MSRIPARPAPNRWTVATCILLAVVTVSLYSQVAWHPFINFDDPEYVTQNQHVRQGLRWQSFAWAWTSTEQANWHPLTWLSHALDWQLYGMNAGGHHFSSVLWHALNVVLLFLLLARATGFTMRSAVVAGLFAVHPLNVESVAWIAERKNVLSMFFFLLALGAYGWYAQRPNWKRYVAVAMLFALGLAAKPMVITLPCVLLLLDYWPLGRVQGWSTKPSTTLPVPQTTWPRLLLEKLPLLTLSVASAIITVIAQDPRHQVATLGPLPFLLRAENAVYSYAMYVEKVFWPVQLAVLYPHPVDRLTFVAVTLSALFLVTVSVLVWRERVNRPYLVIGWLWFLGTLVPVIGLIQVGWQGMADRYAYLPVIGLFVMLVWMGFDWAEKQSQRYRIITAITVVVLLMLVALTFRQIGYWRSSEDLWTHTLAVTQGNFIANDKMGDALLKQGRPEGLRYYQAAANIAPTDPFSHSVLAAVLQDRGNFSGAIQEYEIVLRGNPGADLQAKVYANLAAIYREMGNYTEAREDSERSLRIDSHAVHELIQQFSELLTAHPAPERYFQLGLLQEGAGQIAEARSAYKQALQLDPKFAPAQRALEALGEGKP